MIPKFVIETDKEYFTWLCELIKANQMTKSYWNLAKALHCKEFCWYVPNDDNRAFEAKNLRERFCDDLDIKYHYDDFPERPSMLELIISLAYRCESIMDDQFDEKPMSDWFWVMITNAGLHRFTDDAWEGSNVTNVVDSILDKIVNRTYERNGRGGLFPVKKDRKDQRKVELWYQMNVYLVEHYYSNDENM